jgi:hypothetical protein
MGIEFYTEETIENIAAPAVQHFIIDHEHSDVKQLLLKSKTVMGLPATVIADQIQGRRKAREKFPEWYVRQGIVYPPSLNLEQSSSLATAAYKKEIIQQQLKGKLKVAADLTGGYGIDTLMISTLVDTMHYVEPNVNLSLIARHNHLLSGARNIVYHTTTAEEFIQASDHAFDVVFIDPSRRDAHQKRFIRFADGVPDVTSLMDVLLKCSRLVMIKSSPLLDIHAAVKELNHVGEVYVVAYHNECKEVIYLCGKEWHSDASPMTAINLGDHSQQRFMFNPDDERLCTMNYSPPQHYVYEPNAAILKAGAFKLIGKSFGLMKLHINTHLYTSQELMENFPGRVFQILSGIKPKPADVKKVVPELKANVITRNYPLGAEALKKSLGVADGGDVYIIGCTSTEGKHVLIASRLQ